MSNKSIIAPNSILDEECEFVISNPTSNYCEFFFKASPEVINRISNFIHNYGVTTGKIHKYTEGQHYIYAPIDRIKDGLLQCFRGEIILKGDENQIDYVIENGEDGEVNDITWNEEKLMNLAQEKLSLFWEKIQFINMIQNYESSMSYAEEYNIGYIHNEEPELLTN
jgi:hypothetical protein